MDPNEGTPGTPGATPGLRLVAPSPLLPPVGDYLRQVLALGRRSIVPALPALVLLYCYRFGMGLYMVFSGDATSPLGFPDNQARALALIVTATAYLPLLVLVYTPFLPFQDAILRGTKRSFVDCVKHVLEMLWPYSISSFLQFLIIVVPAAAVVTITALSTVTLAAMAEKARAGLIILSMLPAGLWIILTGFLLVFATPLLILDERGPVASIRESLRLVRRSFGALFGRFFLFVVVLVFVAIFFSLPSAMLTIITAVARQKIIGVEIARLVWDSAVATASFPFSVAGLLILYRALVPAPAAETAAAGDRAPGAVPLQGETTSATPPYRFE